MDHPEIDKISFTGSTAVGLHILRNAGLKRVTMELGGKSPHIVLNDADLDAAIQNTAFSIYLNNGQVCLAGSKTYVQEGIYDEFVKRAAEVSKHMKVGDPFEEGAFNGPLVSAEQRDKVENYCKLGQKEGANLVAGGKKIDGKGYFFEPTVFADVTDEMTIAKEEIFGPVMSVTKFKTLEEVIERANNNEYGLAAGVNTSSMENALAVVNNLQSGTCFVNTWMAMSVLTPFGGYKNSGIGREFGMEGLRPYQETKTVIVKQPELAGH